MMKLARKLGIKPGMKVLIRDAPSDFALLRSSLSDGIKLLKGLKQQSGLCNRVRALQSRCAGCGTDRAQRCRGRRFVMVCISKEVECREV
jgi:hypothetical protein